jgi:hypothetical protein
MLGYRRETSRPSSAATRRPACTVLVMQALPTPPAGDPPRPGAGERRGDSDQSGRELGEDAGPANP